MGRRRWVWREAPAEAQAVGVARALDAPVALGRALGARGVDEDAARRFANPRISEEMASMPPIADVQEAAALLADGARRGVLGIVADYDVDGACSAGILDVCAEACGAPGPVPIAVPERLSEGYGVNERVLSDLLARGCRVLVVVDSGTLSAELLDAFCAAHGVVLVVIDHHPAEEGDRLPMGLLVNPHAGRGRSSLRAEAPGGLCAAALALLVGRHMLREAGLTAAVTERVRARMGNLAGLATVCDVMPMTAFNRALVRGAMRRSEDWPPGILAVGLNCGLAVRGQWTATEFGWRIGPRLNAGSRMGESGLAVACVTERDRVVAAERAEQLERLNTQRRAESDMASAAAVEHAVSAAEACWVGVADCSAGVAGLVAGKVAQATGRPALAFGERGAGPAMSGSGRSALGVDLGAVVRKGAREGVLVAGGGHGVACGAKAERKRFGEARQWLVEAIGRQLEALGNPQPSRVVDCELHNGCLESASLCQLAERLQALEPWGNGAKTPVFGVRSAKVVQYRRMGDSRQHARVELLCEGVKLGAVWWNPREEDQSILAEGWAGRTVDVCGTLSLDTWRGREGRMIVDAVRISGR